MSADSQTLQAKYQKLAAEFAKVCFAVLPQNKENLSLRLVKISIISVQVIGLKSCFVCLFTAFQN